MSRIRADAIINRDANGPVVASEGITIPYLPYIMSMDLSPKENFYEIRIHFSGRTS